MAITTDAIRSITWANVAFDVEDGYVARIDIEGRGLRCNVGLAHRHVNLDTLKACHAEAEEMRAQNAAEIYAEEGYVRMMENSGICYGIPNYTDPQGGHCLCC